MVMRRTGVDQDAERTRILAGTVIGGEVWVRAAVAGQQSDIRVGGADRGVDTRGGQ